MLRGKLLISLFTRHHTVSKYIVLLLNCDDDIALLCPVSTYLRASRNEAFRGATRERSRSPFGMDYTNFAFILVARQELRPTALACSFHL